MEALLESVPDFLYILFYGCPLSFCSFFNTFQKSGTDSIHFKSQARILKVSQMSFLIEMVALHFQLTENLLKKEESH